MKIGFIPMLAGFILMASNALASGWLVEKVGGDVAYAPDGRTWSVLSAGQSSRTQAGSRRGNRDVCF